MPALDVATVRRSTDRLLWDLRHLDCGPARDGVERVAYWARDYLTDTDSDRRAVDRHWVLDAGSDLVAVLAGPLPPRARHSAALALRVADQLREV